VSYCVIVSSRCRCSTTQELAPELTVLLEPATTALDVRPNPSGFDTADLASRHYIYAVEIEADQGKKI
jgi:hypothetical protein